MRPEDVRRWITGFEAAAEADREQLRSRGARPQRSIRIALSMIESGRRAGVGAGPLREAEDEAVRQRWNRLRARLRP